VTRLRLDDHDGAASIGDEKAPVTIVAFIDYQCPFCARAQGTLEEVLNTYGDRVRIVFRHCPLEFHKQAGLAAQAALAGLLLGEFPGMHRLLLARQKDLSREKLTEIAATAGLDPGSFATVLDSGDFAADVERDMELARRIGVASTPFFFVNGRPLRGAQPFSAFRGFIDQELEGKAGPTRWIDRLERPPARDRAAPAEDTSRKLTIADQIAQARSPEAVTEILVRHIQHLEGELEALRDEVKGLRKSLVSVATGQRERLDANKEIERDRIVTVGEVPLRGDPQRGVKEAGIGILMFGDYACPYTRKFSRYTLPGLLERYVDPGRARYVFRARPLEYNARSREAAVAAACAGKQDAYWKMHDALFAIESMADADFPTMAEKLGLDAARFRQCIADPASAKEIDDGVVASEVSRLGIRVVPTLFIGVIQGDRLVNARRVSGLQSLRTLGAVIDQVLAE
jgi:protein-disulfide isomerase